MLVVILINALFALVFPLGKLAMTYAPPFFIVGTRMLCGGIIFLVYQYWTNRHAFQVPRAYWWTLFLLALFNTYISNSFELWGLQYMSSAKACFIYNLSPFISSLLAYFYFNEQFTIKKLIGLLVGFLGFIPLLYFQSPEESTIWQFSFLSLAEIALIIAAITIVYGWILMQDLVRTHHYSSIMANGISMVGGGCMSLIHSLAVEPWSPTPVTQVWPFIGWLTVLTLVSNIICNTLLARLLKKYTATFLSFTNFTSPLFAALYDWLIFGTKVSWDFYLATFIVLIGLYIFYTEELAQGYIRR